MNIIAVLKPCYDETTDTNVIRLLLGLNTLITATIIIESLRIKICFGR